MTADPFAPRPGYQPTEAEQLLLDRLPAEVEDHYWHWVREPVTPALLRELAHMFASWAADLRSVADEVEPS